MKEPIRLDDRIHAVLARDPRMLDTLLATSKSFALLENPLLRKTMAKLATVEHAARVAGLDANALLTRLNSVLDGGPVPTGPLPEAGAEHAATAEVVHDELPEHVRALAVVECDVRDELRAGREPFQQILAAAKSVDAHKVLHLRAIFEPAPLYAVLGRQGFVHATRKDADDDWHVWFWRRSDADRAPAVGVEPSAADGAGLGDDVVIIDVRGLEPPEPMVRTLEALERLPRGKTLVQLNQRVPQFLIPKLSERGFVYEVREQSADLVRLFIRHAT